MDTVLPYLAAAAVIVALNLLPAFGPPGALVVVLLQLNWQLNPVAVVVIGAVGSGAGRFLLAAATRRLRDHLGDRRRASLAAARDYVTGSRGRNAAGLAVFLISPLPSAQLFEAAGLMGVPLLPVTAAHIAGRLVSYTFYLTASTVAARSLGDAFLDSVTSPSGIAIQVALLTAVVLLARVDWTRYLPRARGHDG